MENVEDSLNLKQEKIDGTDKKPLELLHIFGFNPRVPILNLTRDNSSKIFASASSHILQIFSSLDNTQQCYMGHEHEIFALETDSTGRFLLTADKAGVINIWDVNVACEFPHPIRTIYEVDMKLLKVTMSHDAKLIISVSEQNATEGILLLKLWQWSNNEIDNPNGLFEIDNKYGSIENVRFSDDKNELAIFVVTCSSGVLFGQWDFRNKKLLRHSPNRAISLYFRYVDTTFASHSKAISITRCGSGIIWSSLVLSYKKEFVKSIKLCESPLSVIKSVDDFIITADFNGRMRFYDQELKILFWFPSNDQIDSIVTISFDLLPVENSNERQIRNFLLQTNAEIFSVDVTEMKFTQLFYKSDDFITAFDIYPLDKKLICCANYSGRVIMYNFEMKTQVAEHQLKLLKRKSSISDVDVISIPHVSALAFSANGYHLMAGLNDGTVIILDPTVLKEIRYLHVSQDEILSIKFSPDSFFATIYDAKNNLMVYKHCKASDEEWILVGGKSKCHQKRIVDILYLLKASLLPPTISHHHQNPKLNIPRLISLSEDRQIIEYDLTESLKENVKTLTVAFSKRIFQTSIPTAITLIYDNKKHEEQILIADSNGKFKIFDKNTFEILMTCSAPVFDSHVMQFDANTFAGLTPYSKFFVFSTNKNICLYCMPIDGNLFRSLGVMGHAGINGIKAIKVDLSRRILFTIGHKCESIFMWKIECEPLFDHMNEGGEGLEPYLYLLPGGKYGQFFQDMIDIYYYMLMVCNSGAIDEKIVNNGLDVNEVPDFMRALGYYPTEYEIECLINELSGKRKVSFEELVKLYINHAVVSTSPYEMERAARKLLHLKNVSSSEAVIERAALIDVLTEKSLENITRSNAENYLMELFGNSTEIKLNDFLKSILCQQEAIKS